MCSVTQDSKSTPCQRLLLPEASLWIPINSRPFSSLKTSTDLTDYTWEWPKATRENCIPVSSQEFGSTPGLSLAQRAQSTHQP